LLFHPPCPLRWRLLCILLRHHRRTRIWNILSFPQVHPSLAPTLSTRQCGHPNVPSHWSLTQTIFPQLAPTCPSRDNTGLSSIPTITHFPFRPTQLLAYRFLTLDQEPHPVLTSPPPPPPPRPDPQPRNIPHNAQPNASKQGPQQRFSSADTTTTTNNTTTTTSAAQQTAKF
jgi:hypothetical protein